MQTRAGTATTSVDNEAVYLNLISGGTTVTVGLDWIQNSKNDLIGSVGDIIDEVGTVLPGGTTLLLDNFGAAQVKESIGAGVVQNFGNGLTGSIFYAPNYNNTGGGNNGQTLNNSTGTNGAYEIGLRGSNIANSGVNLNLWRNETTKAAGETKALSGTAMTIGYAKAPFSFDIGKMNTTSAAAVETDSKLAQVSYSINKDITASLVRVDTTRDIASATAPITGTSKERINSLMVGYSLGPVGVLLTASRIDNPAGVNTAADIDQLGVTLSTRF
jgi:hypothetical protein